MLGGRQFISLYDKTSKWVRDKKTIKFTFLSQGFSQTLHAIVCLADNAVGPDAQRPDDIVYMYSGRSVEINNTDAEGRLVLGDGVSRNSSGLVLTFTFPHITLKSMLDFLEFT